MDTEEKDLLRRQVVRVMFAVAPCPDGAPGQACLHCIGNEVTDLIEAKVDAERLAR